MPLTSETNFLAAGSISPARFVKIDSVGHPKGGYVLQAAAGDTPCGVSINSVHNAPLSPLDDGYAAIAEGMLRVYGDNEKCLIQTSTVAFPAGTFLKPDATGRGTPATTDGDIYGFRASEDSNGDGISLISGIAIKGAWRGA